MQDSIESTHRKGPASGKRGVLVRLGRDTRGNTLAIVCAALVPLAAMIGSGVDMARAYMAKTRLQSACDAAALAARHAMTNINQVDTTVTSQANKFFNFNFPQGMYQTAAFTPAVTSPSTGDIHITASTTIPTAIMHMFGFKTLPLNVACDAAQNFVNTDIVLVLDTTGSMANDVNDNPTSDPSLTKIQALRDAVMTLYDQLAPMQAQLESQGLRLRYSVVPYASSVNVGNLIKAVNPAYLVDTQNYQSRVATYNVPQYNGTTGSPTNVNQTSSQSSNTNCNTWASGSTTTGGPPPASTTTTTYSKVSYTGTTCTRQASTATTTYVTVYKASSTSAWTYQQASGVDTSNYKLGGSVNIATATDGTMPAAGTYDPVRIAAQGTGVSTTPSNWNGCIEERDTDSSINTGTTTIPSGAYDLDANLIPNSNATRWHPMWPDIEYQRASTASASSGTAITSLGLPWYACPTAAKRLSAWVRSDLLTYVNSLNPQGGTYHDIGLIWGARMISSGGIFADSPDIFNGMPTARFMIFLTDGQMAPNYNSYSAYGVEYLDQRVTGTYTSSSDQLNRHLQRFRNVCNVTKSMNTSIWVIALGTTLSTDLTNCASSQNQAATIASRDALIAQFTLIGQNIGKLRLTQ